MEVLSNNEIIKMFDSLELSIAVFDRDMKMIYMNERAKWFYSNVFQVNDILGKSVKDCHAEINIKNINGLFESFDQGKPLSFFHADPPMIEGGQISVIHYPYIIDNEVVGIMEINIESSLQDAGRGAYERKFNQ